jgi:homoserine O-acetyltransferase
MKRFLCAFVCLFCLATAAAAQEIKFAPLGNFRLENGETIRHLQIGYRTVGTLNADKSNAILWPTWFTGTSAQLLSFIGPGKLLDPSKYFVILVDALGDGVTSSPSNSVDQPRMRFPEFTIRDMVNAEYKLVTERLGLKHLRAVMGISMGGMQTFQWIVAYPDFMDKGIPIVGSPKLTSYDLLLWTAEEHAIEADAAWNHGDYASTPVAGMSAAADIHSLNLTTPAYRVAHTPPQDFPQFLAKTEQDTLQSFDANDWIRQLQAMMAQDVSKPYGGSMEKAAEAVRVQVLVIPAAQDHMVNPTPALNFARLIHAQTLELTSDCGHLSNGCEERKMDSAIQEFLEKYPLAGR